MKRAQMRYSASVYNTKQEQKTRRMQYVPRNLTFWLRPIRNGLRDRDRAAGPAAAHLQTGRLGRQARDELHELKPTEFRNIQWEPTELTVFWDILLQTISSIAVSWTYSYCPPPRGFVLTRIIWDRSQSSKGNSCFMQISLICIHLFDWT